MSGGVVSLLRCVFFYFCREHKLVPPLGQRGFSLAMCGSAGLHYSPHTRAREADRETKVKKKKNLWETPSGGQWWENSGMVFYTLMGIECTIEKSHKPSVLKHHIVLLNGGNKGGKQTVRPQVVVRYLQAMLWWMLSLELNSETVRLSLLFSDSDFFDFLLMCFELLHLYLY